MVACNYNHTQQTAEPETTGGVRASSTQFDWDLAGRMAGATIISFNNGPASRIERGVAPTGCSLTFSDSETGPWG